ncbi:MAG: ankyrin repeat domain-containing protein [Acidobacteria bacterium]|nr:ankyrin repeat domain-containing protein [Acidobacteriota bacterium]MBI3422556.1 ankyrin repeat domain-containing protein [Acidobacteriota bacterium]
MRRSRYLFLLFALLFAGTAWAQSLNEDLLAAARKSDAAAVKALLAKGADVNAKSPYGATPLFFACDRGSAEVVKILLEAGADVNIKDTFYKSTPLTWAIQHDHAEVVKLLVAKTPSSKESATAQAVAQGQPKTVNALLALGGFKPESLSLWLTMAEKNDAKEVAEALKAAGAKPQPKTEFKVEPAQLKRYEGTYKNEQVELSFRVKDGKLIGTSNGFDFAMLPQAAHTFEPEGQPSTVVFKLEGEKVVALTIKGAGGELTIKKVEAK